MDNDVKKNKNQNHNILFLQFKSYKTITQEISDMYESLLRLPYFQGLSINDITAILDKVTLEFKKIKEGDTIYNIGDKCDTFSILTQGELQCYSVSPDNTYSITEIIDSPFAIEPESMFGYDTSYKSRYTAKSECTVLVIDKKFLFSDFIKHNIFTINFLNLISHSTQKQRQAIWNFTPTTIEERIVHFIFMRCNTHKGEKRISIKMERLATILCETRLNISKALNNMQENNLIELHRKEIVVPQMELLKKETDKQS